MAKKFYTLEEAAARLGVSEDQIKKLIDSGRLQQFRDRDKLMFKRDQVDTLADAGQSASGSGTSIPLSDASGETDAFGTVSDMVDLKADDKPAPAQPASGGTTGTGISVFDTDEVDAADSAAQTQVAPGGEQEELTLESVGSGSGLLDLTRESDDTSLGAELLEEIYPGEGSDSKVGSSAVGGSGMFEPAGTQAGAASGIAGLEGETVAAPIGAYVVEAEDPAGDGWNTGMMIGATAAIAVALIVVVTGMKGLMAQLTASFSSNVWMYAGGLIAGSVVLGLIGLVIGKAVGK